MVPRKIPALLRRVGRISRYAGALRRLQRVPTVNSRHLERRLACMVVLISRQFSSRAPHLWLFYRRGAPQISSAAGEHPESTQQTQIAPPALGHLIGSQAGPPAPAFLFGKVGEWDSLFPSPWNFCINFSR